MAESGRNFNEFTCVIARCAIIDSDHLSHSGISTDLKDM